MQAEAIPAIIAFSQRLGLVAVHDGDVSLTEAGRTVHHANIKERRTVFAAVLQKQEWMQEVFRTLLSRGGSAERAQVIEALQTAHGTVQAEELFQNAVYWGRYGGLLRYSSRTERLSLAKPAHV